MKPILMTVLALFISIPAFADHNSAQHNLQQTQTDSQSEKKENRKTASSPSQEAENGLAYKEEYRPESLRQASKAFSEQEEDNKQERRSAMRDPLMTGRDFHEHHNHY